YIYDLAADHSRGQRNQVCEAVIKRIGRRSAKQTVLLYGDGIGTDSLALAQLGHQVTYFDLPGITSSFARFRFGREGMHRQITCLQSAAAIPVEAFDVVVCIEVLEHLPDPISAMRTIYQALRFGGIALITESFHSVGPDYPSHLSE